MLKIEISFDKNKLKFNISGDEASPAEIIGLIELAKKDYIDQILKNEKEGV